MTCTTSIHLIRCFALRSFADLSKFVNNIVAYEKSVTVTTLDELTAHIDRRLDILEYKVDSTLGKLLSQLDTMNIELSDQLSTMVSQLSTLEASLNTRLDTVQTIGQLQGVTATVLGAAALAVLQEWLEQQ
jgi:uncharacterized membrane protein